MKFCPQCSCELIHLEIDGEKRLVCNDSCGFIHWDNPIPVVAALVELDGCYVLARNKSWPEGFYSLISGFVETGESPMDSIARETAEELGLEFISAEFIDHYTFTQMNQLIIAYVVKGKGEIILNDELVDYKLLSKKQLQAYDFGELKLGKLVVQKWISMSI